MGCANIAAFLCSQSPGMDPKSPDPAWAIPRGEPCSGQGRDTGALMTFPNLPTNILGMEKQFLATKNCI